MPNPSIIQVFEIMTKCYDMLPYIQMHNLSLFYYIQSRTTYV